ncbi:hypothetical protein [Kitasatospora sp. MAP5-34]|uniref:hypothetical protein n=1 Tax=Kitasatospora sp. MAP5-34 TaxID=3035102 RepID=UPI002475B79D|nr:hypothetical protein [Kitasatospora sp. MAP5-34]MDH6580737.1 hypothetical protein [Kitasatospora sp. MAP5-34]
MTRSIAARAQAALDHLDAATADPHFAYPARPDEAAAAQLRLANLLGIPTEQVTVTSDGLRRHYQSGEPVLLTVSDPADDHHPETTYRFIIAAPFYDDDPIYLLDACPECGADVPVWTITRITDLAPAKRRDLPADLTADDTLPYDPGHRDTCVYGPMGG